MFENEILLNGLVRSRYSRVLTYPSTDPKEAKSRVLELSGIDLYEKSVQISN